jgi:hypothetical protein
MGIFNFFKKRVRASEQSIRVEFINAADNSVIGTSEMLPAQLPDTFAINTNLDIKDQKWSVQSAEPAEKAQFLKTGKLRLVLSRVTLVNPADILFSLPTISNDIGNSQGDTLPNDAIFAIHEDDWRQVEFVSTQFNSGIDQEFADIQRIWTSERSGPAFKKLHIRKRIPEPLADSSLHLDDLREIIPPGKQFDAVGFLRTRGTIPQSFAWSVCDNFVAWGIVGPDGRILRFCLSGMPDPDEISAISASLAKLTEHHRLHFVDWCRTTKIHSDARAFESYFAQQR